MAVSVLRLDLVHPVISGNKWFKLQGFLQTAASLNKKTVITRGGPFSNHILATAAACAQLGFQSVGIIRGARPKQLSPTLQDAVEFGMKLWFQSRAAYQAGDLPSGIPDQFKAEECLVILEGGYGAAGLQGISTLVQSLQGRYEYVLTAAGTGTTLAGFAASMPGACCIGISVLKNAFSLQQEVAALVPEQNGAFEVLHDYHFGGYARSTEGLIRFMNEWYLNTGIPSDFVYTGKMFFAADDLIAGGRFPAGSSVLLVHTGGLQGNRSLPKGTLIY